MTTTVATTKNWYINSKLTDSSFIILSPLIALLIVALVCEPRSTHNTFLITDGTPVWFAIFATLLTHSHVLLVFVRSHMNMSVFKRYPYRFTVIPLLVLLGMWISPFFFVIVGFVGLYWDEWHSLMQTFGFARIYDERVGNNPHQGRIYDMWMCFVLGLLPHLVLFTFIPGAEQTKGLVKYFDLTESSAIKYGYVVSYFRWPLVIFGLSYTLFYIYQNYKWRKAGYQFSKAKLALMLVTGLTTLYVASVYTVVDGVFFGNIYHALQYYFIVLITERPNFSKLTGLPTSDKKALNALYLLVILPFVFVLAGVRQTTSELPYLGAFWLLTSIMHFWFDGFIWSVRRQDI